MNSKLAKIIIHTDTVSSFFDRAKRVAQKSDLGDSFEGLDTISFEDSREMFNTLSELDKPIKQVA